MNAARVPRCPCGKPLDSVFSHCPACRRRADEADARIASNFPATATPFLPFTKTSRRRRKQKKETKR